MFANKCNEELQNIDKETSNTSPMNTQSEDIDLSIEIYPTSDVKDLPSNFMVCKLCTFLFSSK